MMIPNKGRALLPALLALTLAGCGGGNRFTVVGNLSNLPASQTVLLQEINFDDKISTIDSAKADSKGHFELSGESHGAGLYRLSLGEDAQILLSLSKESVRVSGDYRALDKYTVSGSPASTSLQGFIGKVSDFAQADRTLSVVIKTLKEQGKDSLLAAANNDQAARTEAFTHDIERYADSTTYAPNALYAVHFLNPSAEGSYIEGFSANIAKRFPDVPAARAFGDHYKEYVASQKGSAGNQQFTGGLVMGALAPDISLPSVEGKEIKLSSLRGQYVLLDFWASWCGPCHHENPNVVAAFTKFKDKGFTVYGVSLDEKADAWKDAIAKDGLTWTHVSDLHGWESSAARSYEINEIPANYLLDKEGKIIGHNLRGAALEAKLAEVLK